jgi:glutathione S-transferase
MPHGYALWESHAILRYLCRTQPGGNAFYPEAPEARADAERWMDWTLASMNEPMRVIFWTWVRTPRSGATSPRRRRRGRRRSGSGASPMRARGA